MGQRRVAWSVACKLKEGWMAYQCGGRCHSSVVAAWSVGCKLKEGWMAYQCAGRCHSSKAAVAKCTFVALICVCNCKWTCTLQQELCAAFQLQKRMEKNYFAGAKLTLQWTKLPSVLFCFVVVVVVVVVVCVCVCVCVLQRQIFAAAGEKRL